ncbi:hypothetical protein GOP47_0016992 [Adiantum capillus-veneris]|uniref:Uncharacterized protein n=1 Tax=Adiantum capillus-veneris TaxID=13818 RepID=A0A9D4ZC79_ADICA|nr:hypothetical protein GOP47_0016992 [Adiantum capillus-veneris]
MVRSLEAKDGVVIGRELVEAVDLHERLQLVASTKEYDADCSELASCCSLRDEEDVLAKLKTKSTGCTSDEGNRLVIFNIEVGFIVFNHNGFVRV